MHEPDASLAAIRIRYLRVCLLAIALLPGCQSSCFYDGPREGAEFTAVAGETPTGDASYTQTPFSFAIRYQGFDASGVSLTGFVSVLGFQRPGEEGFAWGSVGEWPVRGQVMALQGFFAQEHPDWLCKTLSLKSTAVPGTGGASQAVCPALTPNGDEEECSAPAFVSVTTNIFSYEEIFNQDVADPDLSVISNECEVGNER